MICDMSKFTMEKHKQIECVGEIETANSKKKIVIPYESTS